MRNKEMKNRSYPSIIFIIMPKSYENQKSICIHKPRVTAKMIRD